MTAPTVTRPATALQPLPFSVGSINRTITASDGEYVAETASDQDARYLAHAANAYPALVAALRARIAYEDERPAPHSHERALWDNERALLAKLGEAG